MINNKIYPKEGEITLGVRRIPLHYLPELEGGNGELQDKILEMCRLTNFYHMNRTQLVDEEKEMFSSKFTKYKHCMLEREGKIYENLKVVVSKSNSQYKECIDKELDELYIGLVNFIVSVDL